MPLYETVFIARQDLAPEEVDALSAKLSKIIADGNGKVVSKEYWGLRNLSYKIKKNSRGHYVLLNINAPYAAVAEMKRVVSFNEDIIRSATYAVESHAKKTLLSASENAKDYKPSAPAVPGKPAKERKDPSKLDLVLDQIQFDL
jgi:small subunit ribosomal protein S6